MTDTTKEADTPDTINSTEAAPDIDTAPNPDLKVDPDAVAALDTADAAGESPQEAPPPLLPRVEMNKSDWRHTLLVLFICGGIFLPVMGSYGMFDPWETHYTEVARQFMVRSDWLSTYWHNGRGPEGYSETNFWSKPVGSFWLSGLSLKIFGYSGSTSGEEIATGHIEWAVRTPFFLCGLFGIFCVYLMCARLFSRRAGLLVAVILATAPMYFQITRQAMTDIPYVGLMSGGIALLILGLIGHREELPRRSLKLGRWTISWPHAPCYYLFMLAFLGIMALQMNAIVKPLLRVPLPFKVGGRSVSAAIVMLVYLALTLVFIWMSRKTKHRNEIYIYWFYVAVAYAGLSKGLVGALQPGMVILLYILVSREWRILTEVALARGLFLAVCVFFPWYHGMVTRHGRSFWNEFFGTEQFRRLTIGEQAQAKGTFDYYVSQIGYGLFPWIAFLPAALVRAFSLKASNRSARDRARLFVYVWLFATVVFFTLTITKYHHYILPAIPPAAILVALFLDDLLAGKVKGAWLLLLGSLGVLAMVTIDMVKQPAHWVWMYTYLYDNNWARGVPSSLPILIYAAAMGAMCLLLLWPRARKLSVLALCLIATGGGGYVLNWYQVKVAPHWSQKKCIATYYKLRKNPEEELVAWQFNWRGETWYTAADVVVSKSLDNTAIKQYLKERTGRRFFFITERGRWPSMRSVMPTEKGRKTLKIVDDSNIHYVLAAAHL